MQKGGLGLWLAPSADNICSFVDVNKTMSEPQTPGHWATGCQTKKGIIKPKIIKQQNWTGSLRTGFHWAVALAHAEALALADPTTGQNNSAIIRQDNEKLIRELKAEVEANAKLMKRMMRRRVQRISRSK